MVGVFFILGEYPISTRKVCKSHGIFSFSQENKLNRIKESYNNLNYFLSRSSKRYMKHPYLKSRLYIDL